MVPGLEFGPRERAPFLVPPEQARLDRKVSMSIFEVEL
jgi:hypothetical protein